MTLATVTVSTSELTQGDRVVRFGSDVAVITNKSIVGYEVHGYYEDDASNPHLLERVDAKWEKVVE